jgi:hypothetical protein
LDESCFIDLISCFHGELSFENFKHVIGCGICICILRHKLFHHFAIDEYIVHTFLESGEVSGHFLEIGAAVAGNLSHCLERTHNFLVTVHSF